MLKEIFKRFVISIYYRSKFERIVYHSSKFYRKSKLKKLANIFHDYRLYSKEETLTGIQILFKESLEIFKKKSKNSENGIILVQTLRDYSFLIKFAAASKVIAESKNLKVFLYDVYWMKWIGWSRKNESLFVRFKKTAFEKIQLSFAEKILYRTEEKYSDQLLIKSKLDEIVNTIKTPEDLLGLKFESILVGDLIYDTYLRYFHKPTLSIIDKDVILIIEIALNIYYSFRKLIRIKKIKVLLNVYTAYIHHGIPVRLCLENEIEVFTVGDSNSFLLKKVEKDFPFHQIDYSKFQVMRKISDDNLKLAKEIFTSRFSGKIDPATSYMRQSAYTLSKLSDELKNDFNRNKRNIVIYVHDFYDSPHLYKKLQFRDFYQFLKLVLCSLTDVLETSVFIKIHPNGIQGCKEQTIELVKKFNKDYFYILDESVSNLNIVELRPDLICTASGTVGLEMAYFGIPTVALHDNLYMNFNFVHSCSDLASYFRIVRGEEETNIDFDKQKIFSFYYQAYLEHALLEENNIIGQIEKNFQGSTYDDEYLRNLFSFEYVKSREKIINYYQDSLCRLEKC
jgi:hypothetical protein